MTVLQLMSKRTDVNLQNHGHRKKELEKHLDLNSKEQLLIESQRYLFVMLMMLMKTFFEACNGERGNIRI